MGSLVARGVVLIAMLAVGWNVNQVWAETVTFGFTGTVTSINPDFIGTVGGTEVVDVGDMIAGTFTYDLDTPGTTGGTGPGGIVIRTDFFSPVPPGKMTYSVGGLTVTTEPGSEFFVVLVGNGSPSNIQEGDVDTFVVGAASSSPTTLESVFRLEDTTQSVFSDTTLPTSLKLDDFDLRRFEVYKIGPPGLANLIFETSIETVSIRMAIDIKPGSDSNPVNPKSKGVTPVAILTTSTFDATTVDALSVKFGPNEAEARGRGHFEDVNGDGRLDLVLHFKTQETGIQCGDTSASLVAETVNGQAIEGSDSIKTVGCKKKGSS